MRNSNKKKKIITCSVLLFSFLSITIFTNFNFEPPFYKDDANKDDFTNFPKTSDSLPSFNGVGDKVNISIHQSYLNNSFNIILNSSDSNNNKFTLPCPTDTTFNSSFTRFEIENIVAPDRYIEIETGISNSDNLGNDHAFSFKIAGNGTLNNFTICFSETHPNNVDATIDVYLYGAIWDTSKQTMKPSNYISTLFSAYTIHDDVSSVWYNFTNINEDLDIADTNNNTFFIYLHQNTLATLAIVNYHYEDDGTIDDSDMWYWFGGIWNHRARDPSMTVYLAPVNNTPRPEQVNMKINNFPVNKYNDIDNAGYWESTDVNSSVSGELQYVVSADWWDVSCNITKVQINYTKTDLRADSSFEVLGNGQDVLWNVTKSGGLNYFDSRFNDYTINFTISSRWDNIQVWNGGTNKTDDIKINYLNNYNDIQVFNAGNGTYWFLNATSNNLLYSIDTYVGGVGITVANFSNIIEFNASFSEVVRDGILNLSVYSPIPRYMNHTNTVNISTGSPNSEIFAYNWSISKNATEYGIFEVQMYWNNGTAAGFLESYLTIVGDTELNVLAPPTGLKYKSGESFNITIQYNNTNRNEGIQDAKIEYSLNNSVPIRTDNYVYIGEGKYNITIFVDDNDFDKYGFVDIVINASKDFHVNLTTSYQFHRQITTSIDPGNFKDLEDIIRGLNVSYTFNYSDTDFKPITQAEWSIIGNSHGFVSHLENLGNGNYTMHLNTSFVAVSGSPYDFMFNVSSTGNETQIITLRVNVQIIYTEIVNPTWTYDILRRSGLNQSLSFFFNDTVSDKGIEDLTTSDVFVRDNSTGILWNTGDFNWELINPVNDGNYILNISLNGKNSGWYTLKVNVSKFPDYDSSLTYITFYLRGNSSQINLISISDTGGVISPTGLGNNFTIFEESDIDIVFNITDSDYSDNIVLGSVNSYEVTYENLGTGLNGILSEDFQFTPPTHTGTLTTSISALNTGDYLINISVTKTNYEDTWYAFNLTIIEKYQTNLTKVFAPTQINAGEILTIIFRAEIYNGTNWILLQGGYISVTPFFNGIESTEVQNQITNSTGEVEFDITVGSNVRTLNITLELRVEYNYLNYTFNLSDISVIPPTPGLTFEELLPYIIIIGAVVAVVGGSLAVYRGIVVPKKREKQRILTEVKTIFDDAINLEHILVLYKGTGTCIFFKSYGSEQIDPELIGGFLTAVSSFGKEMATQEALNEISYGDKMLLLADGQYIRVALVLGKNASLILRGHLKEFIDSFEKTYKEVLPSWRGQLNHFRNAGIIVDEVLNTSIILPHQISYDFSNVKELKSPFSKDVLKVAHSCCEEAEREFFFVATLLKEASEKTSKDTAEIFMGIKELRDKKILIPIEISTIEAQPISQQELYLISQKVASLTTLTNDERQKLVNDLGQLGPMEREAYLSSLTKQHEIVSAPIKTTIGTIIVDNMKSAKKGVKELSKRAKIAKKKKNYLKTIELYQSAAMLASNWELSNEFVQIEDIIRKTKIENLSVKKKDLEKEAKDAVKSKNYAGASAKYKYASQIASEIFKLGASDMTKEVKRLTNKANEYEKLK